MIHTGVMDDKGKEIINTLGAHTGLYSLALGFIISLVLIVIVSLVTKQPSDEILQEFDEMQNMSVE